MLSFVDALDSIKEFWLLGMTVRKKNVENQMFCIISCREAD